MEVLYTLTPVENPSLVELSLPDLHLPQVFLYLDKSTVKHFYQVDGFTHILVQISDLDIAGRIKILEESLMAKHFDVHEARSLQDDEVALLVPSDVGRTRPYLKKEAEAYNICFEPSVGMELDGMWITLKKFCRPTFLETYQAVHWHVYAMDFMYS